MHALRIMGPDGSIRVFPVNPKCALGAGTQHLHIPDSNCDPAPNAFNTAP